MEEFKRHLYITDAVTFESSLGFTWMSLFADLGMSLQNSRSTFYELSLSFSSHSPSLLSCLNKTERLLCTKHYVLAYMPSMGFKT